MIPDSADEPFDKSSMMIRPPFVMEETTHAPLHKAGCDTCKAYMLHVAEGSRNYSLESYFIQKEAEYQRRIKVDVDAAYQRGRKDTNPNDSRDSDDISERLRNAERALDQALEEVERLSAELRELETKATPAPKELNQCGSEVFSSTLAVTTWATDYAEDTRLYINQDNTLIELRPIEITESREEINPHWVQTFSFPGGVMAGSSVAVANSFVSKTLIPDPKFPSDGDVAFHGRGVLRLFCFDTDAVLCEWVYTDSLGWRKSDLNIVGADPTKLAALVWVERGRACWSLNYIKKTDTNTTQYYVYEVRCVGGSAGGWNGTETPAKEYVYSSSTTTEAKAFHFEHIQEGLLDELEGHPQSGLSATVTLDGARRKLFLQGPTYVGPQGANPIRFLSWDPRTSTWDFDDRNTLGNFPYTMPGSGPAPSYASLDLPGAGVHIWIQHRNSIQQWQQNEDETWRSGQVGDKNSSPNAPVAVATKNDKVYIFSISNGKIVQTTYETRSGWVSRPIIVRRA